MRVVRLADIRMGDAIGVFEQIGLAEDDGARFPQSPDKRRVGSGDGRLSDTAPKAGRRIAYFDDILDGNRDFREAAPTPVPSGARTPTAPHHASPLSS